MRLDFWDVLLAHVGSSSVRLFFFGAGRRKPGSYRFGLGEMPLSWSGVVFGVGWAR